MVDILNRVTNVSETATLRRKPTYCSAIRSTGELWHTCSWSEEAFPFHFFSSELFCFLSSLFFPRGISHSPLFQSWSSRSTFPVFPRCSCVFGVEFFTLPWSYLLCSTRDHEAVNRNVLIHFVSAFIKLRSTAH